MGTYRRMACLAAGLMLLAGCDIEDFGDFSRYHQDFHFTKPLNSGGRLSVRNLNGAVEIMAWEKNEVEISGTKYARSQDLLDATRIDISGSPDAVTIRTDAPSGIHGGVGARYSIRVPKNVVLDDITSSNGGIRVDETIGTARLKTSNGAIHVDGLHGDLTAQTSNSGIDLEREEGNVEAHTSNGHVNAEVSHGTFLATTSNSAMQVRLTDPAPDSPVKMDSSNGSLDLTLETTKIPDITMDTSNSSIHLRLPASANADLHASTSNSSISCDFDLTVPGGTHSKNRLDGHIGSGGPRIELSTSNGSVSIRKM